MRNKNANSRVLDSISGHRLFFLAAITVTFSAPPQKSVFAVAFCCLVGLKGELLFTTICPCVVERHGNCQIYTNIEKRYVYIDSCE